MWPSGETEGAVTLTRAGELRVAIRRDGGSSYGYFFLRLIGKEEMTMPSSMDLWQKGCWTSLCYLIESVTQVRVTVKNTSHGHNVTQVRVTV